MESRILEYPKSLSDLLRAYKDGGKIYLLHGRRSKLAFNPTSSLTLYQKDMDIDKIRDFCRINQSKNNLVIGFFSYELGLYTHGIRPGNQSTLPLVELYAFENWIEEKDGRIQITYRDGKFLDKVNALSQSAVTQPKPISTRGGFKPAWNLEEYKAAFERAMSYIKSGDIYQVNLSYPLTAVSDDEAIDIFLQTQSLNQSHMAALFRGSDFELISLSPETFINIEGNRIETFPIKGTRARQTNISDQQIIDELTTDKKEIAELNMISDLLRNDLSIVCKPGSVDIKNVRDTTKLSKVIHTYSHIKGELDSKISSIEALLKISPGGSISGCPKKRALEIIDELEGYARGPYTGCLFSLDPKDNLEASILIRTMIKSGENISLPVGGGIVFDSVYEKEYQETLDKSHSITQVFEDISKT